MRFAEEVQMLQEEQRRILQSLENEALLWDRRVELAASKECPQVRQGAVAHATRQADIRRGMARQFAAAWRGDLANDGPREQPDASVNEDKMELYTILPDSDDEDGRHIVGGYGSEDE